ncbi:MAG: hypothetical protein ACRDP8_15650 [Actinopolymorphaceae bacterium]
MVLSHDLDGSLDAMAAAGGWEIIERLPISLFGRHPEILVATLRSGRGKGRERAGSRSRAEGTAIGRGCGQPG